MIVAGALLLACAVASLTLALRRPSRVERLLWRQARAGALASATRRALAVRLDTLAAAGLAGWSETLVLVKLTAAGAGLLVGGLVSLALGAGPLPIALSAYAAFVAPTLVVERRASANRREAERATVIVVERLHALVASGRPLESALVSLGDRASGSALVDAILGGARRDYTLGAPLHASLARHARAAGVQRLDDLAERLERSRALGRGAVTMLADLRDDLREAERRRSLAAASQVEGKLTLVLTLCYLPALALLVVVPLFLTLLSGLSE